MPFTVHVSDEDNIIQLKFDGSVDESQFLQSRDEVRRLQEVQNPLDALVDMRLADMTLSTMEIFNFGANFTTPISQKIALLIASLDNDMRFLETVARNRGISVTIFQDYDEAVQFLTKKKDT